MKGKFYNNKSDARYMNKSIDLKYDNIPLEILTPASVVRPVLKVSSGLIGQSVNYVYVDELERYYYIRNWVMENGHVQLECEVDVLMSFKNAIKQQNVIVSRQEKNYNLYQSDPKQHFYNTNATIIKEFPIKPFAINNSNFILVLNGASVANV
jgi:hypothetical protein